MHSQSTAASPVQPSLADDCTSDLAVAWTLIEHEPWMRIERDVYGWTCTLRSDRFSHAVVSLAPTVTEAICRAALLVSEQRRQEQRTPYPQPLHRRDDYQVTSPKRGRKPDTLAVFQKRFWSRVDKNGPIIREELGPCWLWTGARDSKGYGLIQTNGAKIRATRAVWILSRHEDIPHGMGMLHACDNPPCVNPDHVRPGTQVENARDAAMRNRMSRVHQKSQRKPGYETLARVIDRGAF